MKPLLNVKFLHTDFVQQPIRRRTEGILYDLQFVGSIWISHITSKLTCQITSKLRTASLHLFSFFRVNILVESNSFEKLI